jgi:hypothetical protein
LGNPAITVLGAWIGIHYYCPADQVRQLRVCSFSITWARRSSTVRKLMPRWRAMTLLGSPAPRLDVGDPAALALAILALGLTDPRSDPRDDGTCRGHRRVSVGEPGHRHRRLPNRAVATRRAGCRSRGHTMGLPLRHARGFGGSALCRELRRLELRLWIDGRADAGRDGHGVVYTRAGRHPPAEPLPGGSPLAQVAA